MDRSENVDGHVIRRERVEPSEIDAAVYRSDVDHFPGVDGRDGGKKFDMRGIVEMVGGRVAASELRVEYDRMFAPATPDRIGQEVANAFGAIGAEEEIVINVVYPMDIA